MGHAAGCSACDGIMREAACEGLCAGGMVSKDHKGGTDFDITRGEHRGSGWYQS